MRKVQLAATLVLIALVVYLIILVRPIHKACGEIDEVAQWQAAAARDLSYSTWTMAAAIGQIAEELHAQGLLKHGLPPFPPEPLVPMPEGEEIEQ
jgi:hypothetical protein